MNRSPDTAEWCEQVRDADSAERSHFVEAHLDLVRYLAQRLASRLPSSVDLEDLVHDGIVGLLDAVDKYDASRAVKFRTYAESRIRGAILDGLRQRDWRPRSVRRGKRSLDETVGRLRAEKGRAATEEEIAEAMGLDLPQYRALLKDVHSGSLLSLDELSAAVDLPSDNPEGQPERTIQKRELLRLLAEEIEHLPERERRVLELYYHEGLTMKEVGAVLGVTESRVCQLHSQAAARLRAAIGSRLTARRSKELQAGPRRRHPA